MKSFLITLMILVWPVFDLVAQVTNFPASAVSDNSNSGAGTWTNLPSGVTGLDVSYGTLTISGTFTESAFLKCTNYGFSIPSGNIIEGIAVTINYYANNTGVSEMQVSLVKNNIVSGDNKSIGASIPTSEIAINYGGSADLWGDKWTPSEINSSNFGAAISFKRPSGGGSRTIYVNSIKITVYHRAPVPITYESSSTAFHPTTAAAMPGSSSLTVLGLKIIASGDINPFNLTKLTLSTDGGNGTGTENVTTNVLNAKVFYTGNSPYFSDDVQFGSTVNYPNGVFNVMGSQEILADTNFFWIVYDVSASAIVNDKLDAQCLEMLFDGGVGTQYPLTPNPVGFRLISNPVVYTVGSSGRDYTTLQAAYNAIPSSTSNNYLIELYDDYNSSLETFPITFNNKLNTAEIIIRPALGQTSVIIQGSISSNGLLNINGARNLQLNGSPGGVGTSHVIMVRNTRNTSPLGCAIFINNDARNIVLENLNIEAETVGSGGLHGIISIGGTTGVSGNDNIVVRNCFLNDLTVGGGSFLPYSAIYSSGNATYPNDFILIENNLSPVCAPAVLFSANTNNTVIRNNSFYLPISFLVGSGDFQFIAITGGSNHIVSGNACGGTAPNCGGSVSAITGSGAFSSIYLSAGGKNKIEDNRISKINYQTTYSGAMRPMVALRLEGNGDFKVTNNYFGSTIGTDSLILTHNGSGGTGLIGIYKSGYGECKVTGNWFGALTSAGSFAASVASIIEIYGGNNIVENNTIGNNFTNNIKVNTNSALVAIYGKTSGNFKVNNNLIQNIYQATGSGVLRIIHGDQGPFYCRNNILQNLTTNSTGEIRLISHTGTSNIAEIRKNSISLITSNNTSSSSMFSAVYVNCDQTVEIDSNLIGSALSNNMLIRNNAFICGVNKLGTGSANTRCNAIQQFNCNNTSTGSRFKGIWLQAGKLQSLNDTIRNISYAGSSGAESIVGIEVDVGATAGNSIGGAQISNILATHTGSANVIVSGIATFISTQISKCHIVGLENKSIGTSSAITGIYLEAAGDVTNNYIWLSNGSNTNDMYIYGIEDNHSSGNLNLYHNTVKISGSQTSGGKGSYCHFRWAAGIDNVQNNIFQNLRTGGTNYHYAHFLNTAAATYTENFNFLQTSNPSVVGRYGGVNKDFSGYIASSGAFNSITGSITINDDGYTSGVIENAGTNLSAFVPDDKIGNTRSTTPWLGAYEVSGPIFRYWVGGTGLWNDVNRWSYTSGGSPGAPVPDATSVVYFDDNSIPVNGTVISIPAGVWTCKNLRLTNINKQPSLTGVGVLKVLEP